MGGETRSDTVVLKNGLSFKDLLKAYEPIIQEDGQGAHL